MEKDISKKKKTPKEKKMAICILKKDLSEVWDMPQW